jgi:hypothetical protein
MEEHIELANRNQAVLEYLLCDAGLCAETIAITAFYKSLHVLEAVFYHREKAHFHSHAERDFHIKKHRHYAGLWRPYRAMSSASYVARYLADNQTEQGFACFADYLPATDVRSKLLDGYLYGFEHLAVQLLPQGHGLNRYPKGGAVVQPIPKQPSPPVVPVP